MSHEHPTAAIEMTQQLVEPMPHAIPCDRQTACEIATDLGYVIDDEWLGSLMGVGCFPPHEQFGYDELTQLFAALDFRERWGVGKNDARKSRTRLALERQDVSLASAEMLAVMKLDSESLLAMLARDGSTMTDEVRQAVVDVIRWRGGLIVTPQKEVDA